MILLTSIDPLNSMVTVRRELISFHQNDDILRFRSFQSLARMTHAGYGNDLLSLISITDEHIGTGRSISKKRITISTSALNTKGHAIP